MRKKLFFLFLLIFSFGCAASHKTADMLNSRMSRMTYEEAIQRFGPPSQCADAGNTKTCVWVYGDGGTLVMPIGNMMMALPAQRPSIRLTFVNGVLSWWQLNGNWE